MKALKKENSTNVPTEKDNAVEEVKTVKKVAPHWAQVGEYPKYQTIVHPFYNERSKLWEVRVTEANGLEVEKHSFETREAAENKHAEMLNIQVKLDDNSFLKMF